MSSANASAANVSRTSMKPENGTRAHNASGVFQGQCTPVNLPALGKQTIVRGNGTNLGTVISLECPATHKVVGGVLVCAMGTNTIQWVGEPYCKPMFAFGDFGYRVAVAASVVSSAIILLLSMAFITCCVRKIQESSSTRETGLWQQQEQSGQHIDSRQHYSHKGRNNNNNTQEKAVSMWVDHNSALCDHSKTCRCQRYYGGAMAPQSTISPIPLPGCGCDQPLLPPYSSLHTGPPLRSDVMKHPSTGPTQHSASPRTSAHTQDSCPGSGCQPVGYIPGNSRNNPATDENHRKNTHSARECAIRIITV